MIDAALTEHSLCGAQILRPDCVDTVAGRSKAVSRCQIYWCIIIYLFIYFVLQPDVVFTCRQFASGRADAGSYLNATPPAACVSLPCKFDLNAALLLESAHRRHKGSNGNASPRPRRELSS